MAGIDATTWLGVYDHPPPEGSGIQAVEVPEDQLFDMDKSLLRGAMQATHYRDEIRDWIGDHF